MCNNIVGSFSCSCQNGYRLDDDMSSCNGISMLAFCLYLLIFVFFINLADIDECLESTDNCDMNYGNCSNTIGSFTCSCVIGFTGDGTNCSSKTCIRFSKCLLYIFK